jgi:mono/diheme cytochrome c family protein
MKRTIALPLCAVALATQMLSAAAQGKPSDDRSSAARIQNPVNSTAASIAAGEKTYTAQCVACHGASGKGDGKAAANLDPKPADLTDDNWAHGSSDGELFAVIRDGSKGTGMKGYGSKLSANDIWNLVNYLRSIGPK